MGRSKVMSGEKMPLYYTYWGKARKRNGASPPGPLSTRGEGDENGRDAGWDYHLLVFHCMDVAAVGRV